MYLSRPLYELLPYVYVLAGGAALAGAWFVETSPWPTILLGAGLLAVVGGLVIWLRRRDFRETQSQYTMKSLDD